MKDRALIDKLRGMSVLELSLSERELLANAVEIADEAARELIESECMFETCDARVVNSLGMRVDIRRGWWNTAYAVNGLGGYNAVDDFDPVRKALSYLARRGLVERRADAPQLVRFIE